MDSQKLRVLCAGGACGPQVRSWLSSGTREPSGIDRAMHAARCLAYLPALLSSKQVWSVLLATAVQRANILIRTFHFIVSSLPEFIACYVQMILYIT